jgi:aspartate kinase
MNVFKFGGASIETVERAKNVANIIQDYANNKLLVVISAKGKTTNALEKIVHAYFDNQIEEAQSLLNEMIVDHQQYAAELLNTETHPVFKKLTELFTEIEFVLSEPHGKAFDYYYDQIVSIGELLSTSIIQAYLETRHISSSWIDVRDILKTDSNYRDANVLWDETERTAKAIFEKEFETQNVIITQGFIGSTDENNTVTLGREGSDYSAAIFANMLDAESVTIWKDVPSLLNGDPKIFPNTVPIKEITYHEVIEMAFYGAQVIHPKTIKPLFLKSIPLYVKCFLDKTLEGTKIFNTEEKINYPPILVLKQNQTLLEVQTKDYSFITDDKLSDVYELFHKHKLQINLIQHAAIRFVALVDSHKEKLDALLQDLSINYSVKRNEDLFLFTVRHYNPSILEEELKNREVILTQKTRQTIQIIAK